MTNQERLKAIMLKDMAVRRMENTGETKEEALMFIKKYLVQHLHKQENL